jgi:3-oxoacyl-[acyl-carrier-protein] synthase-3
VTLRSTPLSPGARILGVGAYEPSRVVTNEDLLARLDSSDEWIRQRTGIVERRWATPDETVTVMAAEASRRALAHAGLDAGAVDAIVVSTVTRFVQWPAIASRVAAALGIPSVAAFDLSAGCAGFCYALAQADALVRAGTAGHVLVIAADRLSDMTDLADRSTAFLFGDGAGAVVVGPSAQPGIGPVTWGGDADQADTITQTQEWTDALASGTMPYIVMAGQKVFKWAMTEITDVTRRAIEAAGLTPADIDLFVPHQANDRITDALLRYLKLPESVVVSRNIRRLGNTSASSIPLGIARLYADGLVRPDAACLMVGFGAGLVYAGQVALLPAGAPGTVPGPVNPPIPPNPLNP